MKKLRLILIMAIGLVLVACGQSSDVPTIRVATSPGPYSILFMDEVAPRLEEQGYTIEEIQFSELRQADIAVQEGDADLNVDGNRLHTESMNDSLGADFTPITTIPTVPSSIYPGQKATLDEVEAGDTVGVGESPVSLMRSLLLLQKIGWIKLNEDVNPAQVTLDDIEENYAGIEIIPMQIAALPRSMPDLDYGVISGSIASDSDMDLATALESEDIIDGLYLEAITRAEDADSDWANAVKEIYQSDEFKQRVEELNEEMGITFWNIPEYNAA